MRFRLFLLSALALLTGALSAQAAPIAPQLCDPLPSADQNAEAWRQAANQRQQHVLQALQLGLPQRPIDLETTVASLADCLTVTLVPGGKGRVATVDLRVPGYLGPGGVLLWWHDGDWRTAPANTGQWWNLLSPLKAEPRGDGYLLVTVEQTLGAGGMGRLLVYGLTKTPSLLWQSPRYEQFITDRLGDDVLVGFRPHESHRGFALRENCCLPNDGQALYRQSGDSFVLVAHRIYPNPWRSVNLFVGAIQQGDRRGARQWATNDAVVEQAALLAPQLDAWAWYNPHTRMDFETHGVDTEEALYWDAIPAKYRGSKPIVTRIVRPVGQSIQIVTVRTDQGWRVAEILNGG